MIDAFRPSDETEKAVRDWLVASGIPATRISHAENKGWFAFYATAAEAENLLLAEYHEYEDTVTGGVIPACDQYHLPKSLREHIDYISPGIKLLAPVESHKAQKEALIAKRETSLGLSKRMKHAKLVQETSHKPDPNDLSTCDIAITPACVAALYKIPKATLKNPNNSMGIFESELQFYTQYDLDSFFTNFTSYIANGTHPVAANIDGGQQSTEDLYQAGGEVSLDLQLAYPIVYPQTITNYQVDDFIVQSDQLDTYTYGFNTFLDALDGVCTSDL